MCRPGCVVLYNMFLQANESHSLRNQVPPVLFQDPDNHIEQMSICFEEKPKSVN